MVPATSTWMPWTCPQRYALLLSPSSDSQVSSPPLGTARPASSFECRLGTKRMVNGPTS